MENKPFLCGTIGGVSVYSALIKGGGVRFYCFLSGLYTCSLEPFKLRDEIYKHQKSIKDSLN